MIPSTIPAAGHPIRGVIFDLNATLIHGGDPALWVAAAHDLMARETVPAGTREAGPAGSPHVEHLTHVATHIWDLAREIDPGSERDLSPAHHRTVYDALIERQGTIPATLADALYRTMLDQWTLYDETLDVLAALRGRGIRLALLSNVGPDPRPTLARLGLAGLFDAEVLSLEVGVIKPDPQIFRIAVERLGLDPAEVLMVGDTVEDDGGAAQVGIRTLILPRASGTGHGLGIVLRLVG